VVGPAFGFCLSRSRRDAGFGRLGFVLRSLVFACFERLPVVFLRECGPFGRFSFSFLFSVFSSPGCSLMRFVRGFAFFLVGAVQLLDVGCYPCTSSVLLVVVLLAFPVVFYFSPVLFFGRAVCLWYEDAAGLCCVCTCGGTFGLAAFRRVRRRCISVFD